MRFDAGLPASLLIAALIVLLLGAGCQSSPTPVPDSLTAQFGGSEVDAQMEFWHRLTEKSLTSNDDSFHGLLLYMDGEDDAAGYQARVEKLRARNMLPRGFDDPGDVAVSRGTLAVAIMRLTGLSGGVTSRIFGVSPRYAVRELMFAGVYPPSSPNQTFSGFEFVGIIGRIEDYQRGNPANVPAAVLPGQVDALTGPSPQ
ncbi:MAG TPA: hypothetical protein VGR35_06390 [Tepidisphaeraceae bacterium]|nr:hypothetical protein [Tepidisphaeraceae bacterium]